MKTVKRKAVVGDKVLITNAFPALGEDYKNGDILVIIKCNKDLNSDFPHYKDIPGCMLYDDEYEVIITDYKDTDSFKESSPYYKAVDYACNLVTKDFKFNLTTIEYDENGIKVQFTLRKNYEHLYGGYTVKPFRVYIVLTESVTTINVYNIAKFISDVIISHWTSLILSNDKEVY